MLVGEVPQTPLFCIFQCRLRVPAGHFLSDDTFRVIENLHKVRCSFCQRSILYPFRDRRIQKQNAPFLHTVRKLFLCQQCSLPAHLRESVSVQNVGNMKSAVAVFRQLHHGIVVNPEMAEPESAADVLHVMAEMVNLVDPVPRYKFLFPESKGIHACTQNDILRDPGLRYIFQQAFGIYSTAQGGGGNVFVNEHPDDFFVRKPACAKIRFKKVSTIQNNVSIIYSVSTV